MQRVGLAQGLSMRPPSEIPHTNAAHYRHPELKKMIDTSEAEQVHELGQIWNDLGNEIMDFGANLQRTATSSEAIWIGEAGNAAREALSTLATWSQHTGQGVQFMGTTMRTQAEAAHTAQRAMPEPVPYDPTEYQTRLNSTINPIAWVHILGDARKQADRHHGAYVEAIRVIETYGASLRDTNTTMPAFMPPPEFGNEDARRTPGHPMPSGGTGGGGMAPRLSGAGGGATGGVPDIDSGNPPTAPGTDIGEPDRGGAPPSSTPGQSAPYTSGLPGGDPAAGSGGGAGAGSGGRLVEPSFLPTTTAGTGGAGPGERGFSTGGGHAGGAGGGFGPRGSGASNALGRGGFGSAGGTESATGAGKGVAGMAGRGPGVGPGTAGVFPPMVSGGRGQGEEDTEHRRPSYLVETEDIWGDGHRVAPPVIGEDPPEYHY